MSARTSSDPDMASPTTRAPSAERPRRTPRPRRIASSEVAVTGARGEPLREPVNARAAALYSSLNPPVSTNVYSRKHSSLPVLHPRSGVCPASPRPRSPPSRLDRPLRLHPATTPRCDLDERLLLLLPPPPPGAGRSPPPGPGAPGGRLVARLGPEQRAGSERLPHPSHPACATLPSSPASATVRASAIRLAARRARGGFKALDPVSAALIPASAPRACVTRRSSVAVRSSPPPTRPRARRSARARRRRCFSARTDRRPPRHPHPRGARRRLFTSPRTSESCAFHTSRSARPAPVDRLSTASTRADNPHLGLDREPWRGGLELDDGGVRGAGGVLLGTEETRGRARVSEDRRVVARAPRARGSAPPSPRAFARRRAGKKTCSRPSGASPPGPGVQPGAPPAGGAFDSAFRSAEGTSPPPPGAWRHAT